MLALGSKQTLFSRSKMTILTLFCAQASTTPSRSSIEFKHAIRTFSSRSARENWSRDRTLKVSCRSETHKIPIFRDFQETQSLFCIDGIFRIRLESGGVRQWKMTGTSCSVRENWSQYAARVFRLVFLGFLCFFSLVFCVFD